MADRISKQKRSEIMSKIRSKNTKPEIILRELLDGRIFRYQPRIYGKPDFGNDTRKIAVFVDGCFWHGCPECSKMPKSRQNYWSKKIGGNRKRDSAINKELARRGYKVIRVWEHQVLKDQSKCIKRIYKAIK